MNSIKLNPKTQKNIEMLANNLPQSLLISGQFGIGLKTAALYLAELSEAECLVIEPEKDEKVDLINGIINIDLIRKIQDRAKMKLVKPQIVIIHKAETMTIQAQNAFLKLLEEPTDNFYVFILSHDENKLLPTILSRVEQLKVLPIDKIQSEKILDSLKVTDAKKRAQILFLAQGLPAKITSLARDDNYFNKQVKAVQDARNILNGKTYEKLAIIQSYKSDKQSALLLLDNLILILRLTLDKNPRQELVSYLEKLLTTYEKINANCNVRLSLAQLVL